MSVQSIGDKDVDLNAKNMEADDNVDHVFTMPAPAAPLAPPPLPPPPAPAFAKPAAPLPLAVPELGYTKPEWSAQPPIACDTSDNTAYFLEVIKSGSVLEPIALDKEWLCVGRLNTCHIHAEHPTLSRHHAIFQYSSGVGGSAASGGGGETPGFYLYDLGSTHGTFVNKKRIAPRQYVPLQLDSVIKFGQSTRLYILHGPAQPDTSSSSASADDLHIELTHEQMRLIKEKHARLALRVKVRRELDAEEAEQAARDESSRDGIDWGLGGERELSAIKGEQQAALTGEVQLDDSFYADDPRKALKTFFDREGVELHYEVEEVATGKFKCRIALPIQNAYGESIVAEAKLDGKKKECMSACALEACRILDADGVLRQGRAAVSKKQRRDKDWESGDFYDSDDDTYLDRTGDVERKRTQRIKAAAKAKTPGLVFMQNLFIKYIFLC